MKDRIHRLKVVGFLLVVAVFGCDSGVSVEEEPPFEEGPTFSEERVIQQQLDRSAESGILDMAGPLALIGRRVYRWDGAAWTLEVDALQPSTVYSGEAVGYPSAATDGQRVIVGTDNNYTEHCGNSYVGRVLVFEQRDQQWQETTELISPSDGALYCGSGHNVDINGGLLLAKGLPHALDPATGAWTEIPRLGRLAVEARELPDRYQVIDDTRILISYYARHIVEIIEWTGTTWQTVASGSLSHIGTPGRSYGPVAYSDGFLIVSARDRAYIFALVDGVFAQVAELTPEEGLEETAFGASVAIDGPFAAVSDQFAYAVYLYEYVGEEWVKVATFRSSDWPDFPEDANFGPSMVLSDRRILISSRGVSYTYAW